MRIVTKKAFTSKLALLLLPVFLLAIQANVASAKNVRGTAKIAQKLERCKAKIYKRKGRTYIRGKCAGAINSSFSGLYSNVSLVKRKGKYVITTRMVNRSSKGFTLKIRAYNRKNRKTYKGSIRMK